MRRKLVEQGGTTMMVSLPSKWIKRFDLKKGDEIIIEEDGKMIHLSTDTINRSRAIQIDLRDMNDRVIKWIISGLHKFGFDEIEILYNQPDVLPVVDWLLKNLMIGFALIEQTSKRIVLKNITQDTDAEFNATLRRAFLVTNALAESSIEAIREKEFDTLKSLISLEETNNQLTNFCERILNKRGFLESKKTSFMYTIIWNLEKVCDDFKYICELPIEKLENISEEILNLFEGVKKYFRGYYELYYKFNYRVLLELKAKKDLLMHDARELLENDANGSAIVVSYLLSLIYKITDFSTSMVCMHLEE